MSTWYDYDIKVMGYEKDVAQFFGVKPEDIHHIDDFELSMSQKNGIDLTPLMRRNPDLIFLVASTCESYATTWYMAKYDRATEKVQSIRVMHYSGYELEINKQIMAEFPRLLPQYLKENNFRWSDYFGNYARNFEMLAHSERYEEMSAYAESDLEFDNAELVEHVY